MQISADSISRREALRRAAFALGGTISAPTLAGVLAGCGRDRGESAGTDETPWTPRALSAEQRELVATIAEHIIPQTDTPGARAVGVDRFIDAMLADFYPAKDRDAFLQGLARVDQRAQQAWRKNFVAGTAEQQLAMLTDLDRRTFPAAEKPLNRPITPDQRPTTQQGDVATGRSHGPGAVSASGAVAVDAQPDPEDTGAGGFWRNIKELTLVGYYTSEVGSTQELRVNPMGPWRADIPFAEVGSAWA